jgi:hypothetical protein
MNYYEKTKRLNNEDFKQVIGVKTINEQIRKAFVKIHKKSQRIISSKAGREPPF